MKKQSLYLILAFFLSTVLSMPECIAQTYDANLDSVYRINGEYTMTPLHHTDTFRFGARVRNDGSGTINDVKVQILNTPNYTDSISLDSLQAGQSAISDAATGFMPTAVGTYDFYFTSQIRETDMVSSNNLDTNSFEITDTIMARDFGIATGGGAGFNGAANNAVGTKFLLKEADTITSISFYLATATVGESVRVHLYNFNNVPLGLLGSSQPFIVPNGQGWYTLPLICPAIVGAGEYFATVEQLGTTNMGLGIYTENFYDSTVFYGPNGNWLRIESIPFLRSPMIRINVGPYDTYREVNISASATFACEGRQISLAGDADADYSWSPSNLTFDPTSRNPIFTLTNETEIIAVADFGCGLIARDTITIPVEPAPVGGVTRDTTICAGESITLNAFGGSGYRWSTGPSNMPWTVSPSTRTSYLVTIDSTNGCNAGYTTTVDVSQGTVAAMGDTTVCSGEPVLVSASGAVTYQWDNGPSDSTYSFNVSQTEYKYVTGFNTDGCPARDSVLITENVAPELVPMSDTGACFTNFITIRTQTIADNYTWNNGNNSDSVRLQMLSPQSLTLTASNTNGCAVYDTVLVSRYLRPNGSISPSRDTTICEGTSLAVTASGGANYEWSNGQVTATATLEPTELTTYQVIIRSAEGCEDFEEIEINLAPLPTSAFRFREFEDSLTFDNQSSLATSYAWDFGDGNTSTDENTFNVYDTSGMYTVTLTATNECGSRDSSITIDVEVPAIVNSITDLEKWGDAAFYPNPTNGEVHIQIANKMIGEVQMEIIDLSGRVLFAKQVLKNGAILSSSVDLSELSSGAYTLRLTLEGAVLNTRLMKY